MSVQIEAERTETAVPLDLVVSDGTTGLTVVVQIRDGKTTNSYLDFSTNGFTTTPVTKTASLTEVGGGIYSLSGGLDLSAITNLPSTTNRLIAEFLITGSLTGTAIDVISLRADVFDLAKAILLRAVSTVEPLANERTLAGAIEKLVNRIRVNGANLEIFEADDTTVSWSQTLTTNPGASPVVEADTN